MIFSGLAAGEYIVRLTVKARCDTEATVTTNHRRFLVRNLPLKEGETFAGSYAVALRPADFQKRSPYDDSEITLDSIGDVEVNAEVEAVKLPVLYCLGDSTVCDQEYSGGSALERCCGWGQTLGMYLGSRYAISNHAEQGTHTADCLACHIKPVLNWIRPGDIVLAQFGHNDQKQDWLGAFGGYKDNLVKIARAVMEKGAQCVLCTPINRLIYVDGALNTYLDEYARAVRETAAELGIKYIDLHAFTSEAYLRLGDKAEDLFYHPDGPLDRTHPNDNGGVLIGEYVAKNL